MNRKWWIAIAVSVAMLIATAALGVRYWPAHESPRLTEVKQLQTAMQQKLFTPGEESKQTSPDERRAMFEKLHEKMEALPEAERKQAAQAMQQGFMQQMQVKMDKFFAMSPAEQSAALDKDIDEQEARRKAWGGMPFPPPPGGQAAKPGPPTSAAANGDAKENAQPANRPPGPGPGRWPEMDAQQRKQMQRQMLDNTTPEFRAKMTQYIRQVEERRQARGLPTFRPF
ncbi:MAG: hypothetical protein K8T25_19910 [Planctomycetia bacterium]|nr:hypothetical protein [Planctomycetia bacterium]